MKRANVKCANDENEIMDYKFPKEFQESFRSLFKQGIYKELHKRNLLSDAQLNSLLNNK